MDARFCSHRGMKTIHTLLRSDRGVTFVEVITTLLILSVVMITLATLGTRLIPPLARNRQEVEALHREILLRRALSRGLGEITPPWWMSQYAFQGEPQQWEFPWYGGLEEQSLIISSDQDGTTITWSSSNFLETITTSPQATTDDAGHLFFPQAHVEEITLLSQMEAGPPLCRIIWYYSGTSSGSNGDSHQAQNNGSAPSSRNTNQGQNHGSSHSSGSYDHLRQVMLLPIGSGIVQGREVIR